MNVCVFVLIVNAFNFVHARMRVFVRVLYWVLASMAYDLAANIRGIKCVSVSVYVCTCVFACVCVCKCSCVFESVYMCVYVCVSLYACAAQGCA